MSTKKLTKAERLVQEQMLALLEWAADRPKSWHPIGTLPETVDSPGLRLAYGDKALAHDGKTQMRIRAYKAAYQNPGLRLELPRFCGHLNG